MVLKSIIETYSSVYSNIKHKFPNFYIVCISILVTIWFQGMSRLINGFFPNNGISGNLLLMIVPALLLYFGDGKLEEIYSFENLPSRLMAITRTTRDYQEQ